MSQSIHFRSRPVKIVLVVGAATLLVILLYLGLDRYVMEPDVHIKALDVATQQTSFIKAPEFTLVDLALQNVSLADFKEKVVIVNFWASWCGPCVREFPSLLRFAKHFKGQVVVVAISQDNDPEQVSSFLKKINFVPEFPFFVVMDRLGATAKQYGVLALPESFVLKKPLIFERKISGFRDWMGPTALEETALLLNY